MTNKKLPLFYFFLVFIFLFLFSSAKTQADARWSPGIIDSPRGGYIDSVFVTPDESRIYFLHSVMAPLDFALGTSTYPRASYLPNHTISPGYEWNSDLYYIEWTGSAWGAPVNLGPNINTRANECCMWLNDNQTEIIFFREENIPAPRGNLISTRASKNDPWGPAVFLPGEYGSENQSASLYRHDIQKMANGSGDIYMWQKDNANPNNPGKLLYGKKNASGWLAPEAIAISDSTDEETQPWVSSDEKTILYTRRNASAATTLWKMERGSASAAWGAPSQASLSGFNDPNGLAVWGEVNIPALADKMIALRLNTALPGWQSEIIKADGSPLSGFSNLTVLNSGSFAPGPSPVPPPVPPPASLSNLSFSFLTDTNLSLSGKTLTLSILPQNSTANTTPLYTQSQTASGLNQITLSSTNCSPSACPPNTYDIRIKALNTLSKKQTFTLSSNQTFTFSNKLISGDINNDNAINSLDWSLMSPDWFQTNKTSDINGDGITNALDFTWLNRNWFLTGE